MTAADRAAATSRDGIARAAVLIAVVTLGARLAGFVRVIVFARTVGPSCLGDAYYTANTIPNIVFDIVAGGALSSLVVPLLAGPVSNHEDTVVDRTSSALLTWVVVGLVPVAVLGAVFAHPLIGILVGGGHPGCGSHRQVAVGARMLVVFMPQVLLYGLGIVVTGVVQAHRRFLAPAVGPLTSSVVVIGAYLLFAALATGSETGLVGLSTTHELILSVGTTLGVVALVVPLLVPLLRTGVRLRPTLRFPAGVAAQARRLALSGVLILGSQDVATAVVLRLTNSNGHAGAVVLYNLAWTVFLVPWAVLAVPLATSAFPELTSRWYDGDTSGYAATTSRSARVLVAVAISAAAFMAAAASPVARLVVLGAPGRVAPVELARGLVGFAPGVVAFSLTALLSRVLYARGDARQPAVATALGWAVAVVADVVLVAALPPGWTVAGLGVGTSIGVSVTAAWLLLGVRRAAGRGALRGLAATAATSTSGGVLAAGCGTWAAHAWGPGSLPACVAAAAVVAVVVVAVQSAAMASFDAATFGLIRSRLRLRRG